VQRREDLRTHAFAQRQPRGELAEVPRDAPHALEAERVVIEDDVHDEQRDMDVSASQRARVFKVQIMRRRGAARRVGTLAEV
jgi:hypothetical protein